MKQAASKMPSTTQRIEQIVRDMGLRTHGGGCFETANAINRHIFGGRGKIVLALNKYLWTWQDRAVGHAAVFHGGRYWDGEGSVRKEDLLSWGMVDPDDPDYSMPDEESAYEVVLFEPEEDTLRGLIGSWHASRSRR